MLFNSFTFLLFFAIVLAVHNLPLSWRVKKWHLVGASYLFYAAWNPPFVALLALSTLVDWFVARRMWHEDRPTRRRLLLVLSLCTNLGMLAFFKYGQFAVDNLIALLAGMGVAYQPAAPDIILPVGISFYTFQTLSYTIDVYRRKLEPRFEFVDFALFVSFFPQLVAGPIVRASDFLPQTDTERRATASQLGWGFSLLVIGLFQKVALADGLLAEVVNATYRNWAEVGFTDAWVGTLAFAGQIFFDFAGYSTAAIGAAMCLGFALPDNFRYPYAAVGFSDFWRRWHISLSSWLRDYLYISMGGNRHGQMRTYVHLMLTMLLGGLWHGASWRFVAWGFLHGFYLVIERGLRHLFEGEPWADTRAVRVLAGAGTFVAVCYAWVFFRADSFPAAFQLVGAMSGFGPRGTTSVLGTARIATTLMVTTGLLAHHAWMRDATVEDVMGRLPWGLRSMILATLLLAIYLAPAERSAFIYFQF